MYVSPVVCAIIGLIMGICFTIIGIIGITMYIDNKKKKKEK